MSHQYIVGRDESSIDNLGEPSWRCTISQTHSDTLTQTSSSLSLPLPLPPSLSLSLSPFLVRVFLFFVFFIFILFWIVWFGILKAFGRNVSRHAALLSPLYLPWTFQDLAWDGAAWNCLQGTTWTIAATVWRYIIFVFLQKWNQRATRAYVEIGIILPDRCPPRRDATP